MQAVLLLTVLNVFMTMAWYGHRRYKDKPLWIVIVVSWLIAYAEYCFQVPANRIGHYQFNAAQLKTIQEVITLMVFAVFSVVYLKEELKWNYPDGFGLMVGAVFLTFKEWQAMASKKKEPIQPKGFQSAFGASTVEDFEKFGVSCLDRPSSAPQQGLGACPTLPS